MADTDSFLETPTKSTHSRSKSDLPTSRILPPPSAAKKSGKKALRPWRRFTGRFQHRNDYEPSLLEGREIPTAGPPANTAETTYMGAAVNSLRSLATSTSAHRIHTSTRSAHSSAASGGTKNRSSPSNSPSSRMREDEGRLVVIKLEHFVRQVGVLAFSYTLGTHFPQALPVIQKIAEYSLVAWLTCVGILVTTAYHQRRPPRQQRQEEEQRVLEVPYSASQRSLHKLPSADEFLLGGFPEERTPLLTKSTDLEQARGGSASSLIRKRVDEEASPSILPVSECVHPALEPFYVMNAENGERVPANVSQPTRLTTDYFEGKMVVMIRTPNVDDPKKTSGNPENSQATKHLTGKQRRFEFQFQFKLKKIPTGRVYFATELSETVKMGMVSRAFVSAAMAFIRTTNSSFHYSMTGNPVCPDGRYEKPHMAFPVEEGMNRIVVTPQGQTPPPLGGDIVEDPESYKRRKKGVPMKWSLEDTYTMSLWSAYTDFLDWRCCNLPGIRPFGLVNVIGRQAIHVTLYEIPEDVTSDKHYRCDMIQIAEFELSNRAISAPGALAKKFLAQKRSTESPPRVPALVTRGGTKSPRVMDDMDVDDEAEEEDDELGGVEDVRDQDEDEDAAAELGEGIYVRSGDVISLRESPTGYAEGEESDSFVTNGGGFAVLRGENSSSIIVEKASRSRFRSKSSRSSRLIKTGDTVVLKLIVKGSNGEEKEVRYLSLHRGWWLKWVAAVPTKNGFFTIHTNDPIMREDKGTVLSNDTDSSYLTLGGSFFLRHRRWSKYLVGVAREGSATYGGRMLGLYNPKDRNNSRVGYNTEKDELTLDSLPETEAKGGERYIRSLYLEVCDSSQKFADGSSQQIGNPKEEVESRECKNLMFSSEDNQMDAPAWVEIMNRSERVRQLVFAIRVLAPNHDHSEFDESTVQGLEIDRPAAVQETFIRFRTGRDLSQVMRAGLTWRNRKASPRRRKSSVDREGMAPSTSGSSTPISNSRHGGISTPTAEGMSRENSFDDIGYNESANTGDSDFSDESFQGSIDDDLQDVFEDIEVLGDDAPESRSQKGRKLIGKIARSVKTRTATTGKKVVRRGVKVGKGTVNAGKAIISGRPRQPPSKEPKSGKLRSRRSFDRDLRVAVSNRSIKRVERVESRLLDDDDHSSFLAGELSAPEQSCRTVSNMLSRMSSVPPMSPVSSEFSALLASQVEAKSQFDDTFLQGGSVELGVIPTKDVSDKRFWVYDCLVARCLWESHWREEWCGVQRKRVVFFAPLTKEPVLEISFRDIQGVRLVEPGQRNPLPGYPILAIETAWSCHYMALASEEARETLRAKLEESVSSFCASEDPNRSEREAELWNARLWQGLQDSWESSLSSGRGKWADVHSMQRHKRRIVLNNRRMFFDIAVPTGDTNSFVEDLLSTSLSFSLDSLQHHPEAFSEFLDSTSMLRGLRLQGLNRSDTTTFCIFVNLYHCLLQHALLLTPDGPLQKRSCEDFMRTCCYEIGGDVFSLAELNYCIIRGNMSRSSAPRAPYVEAPKKSAPFRYFALTTTTPNVNFLVNTGDVSCPNEVPVLRPDRIDEQLAVQTAEFLKKNVSVDVSKRQVIIPKVCEVFRNDFTSDFSNSSFACLRYCLRYLDEPTASRIYPLLQDESGVTIKYQTSADQYHSTLRQRQVEPLVSPTSPASQTVASL